MRPRQNAVFTRELALRIASRVARGTPIRHAVALEGDSRITVETYQKCLEKNAVLRGIHESVIAEWVDTACERLSNADPASVRWLLQTRHPNDFARPEVSIQNNLTINGMPKDMLTIMREAARKQLSAGAVEVEAVKK